MRIGGGLPADAASDDVATSLEVAARALGMRPGLVVIGPEGRSEQGIASLANWAAKTANLLVEEAGLGAGDRLGLDAPPGWTTASACLAAWWLGIVIVPAGTTEVVVRHVRRPPAPHARLELVVGDAFDGSAPGGDPERSLTWRAQVLPDRPPPPVRAGPRDVDADDAGRFGAVLAASVLRPIVTGSPTVVVLDGRADRADGEGVTRWLEVADLAALPVTPAGHDPSA